MRHALAARTSARQPAGWRGGAFTLIELLIVIAIIAILAGMLLSTMSRGQARAQRIGCLSNYRQLQLCWLMYAEDHQDALPPNATSPGMSREGWIATAASWVTGNAWTDSTTANVEQGALFPYNRTARIYKCPADRATVRDPGKLPRVRSVSMSMYMNDSPAAADPMCWHRLSQVRDPPPARALVFMDEHQDSIENGRFVISQPGDGRWLDFLATRHDNGCTVTFADGHAEPWRWLEPNTLVIAKRSGYLQDLPAVSGRDRVLERVHQAVPRIPIP